MRRARLKITPNLCNLGRAKPSNPAPLVENIVEGKDHECSAADSETHATPDDHFRDSQSPPLLPIRTHLKISFEKENDANPIPPTVPVPTSPDLVRTAKKTSFPKSKAIPNLNVSRKRTISSSSTGSSCRTRTLSGTSSISELPIEIPIFDQRKADHKKRFHKGVPERSKMTVFDFIFHNPSEGSRMNSQDSPSEVVKAHRDEDDPDTIRNSLSDKEDGSSSSPPPPPEEAEDQHMPVPQVKIGPDGQIVLDEDSTFIETTATKKAKEDLLKTSLVYENHSTNYGTWGKKRKNSEWNKKETLRFYKALSIFGTDFSMMASIFKKKDRHDLKMKFKKEERVNRNLVDRCLCQNGQFDLSVLGSEEDEEDETSASQEKKKRASRKRSTDKKDNDLKKKKKKISKSLRRSRGYYSSSSSSGDEEGNNQVDIPWRQTDSPNASEELQSQPDQISSTIEQTDKDATFPPGLLAANPGLANATSGSLVVVAATPTTENTNLHFYMVNDDKNDSNSKSSGRVRTLSASGNVEPASPKQSSKSDDKNT